MRSTGPRRERVVYGDERARSNIPATICGRPQDRAAGVAPGQELYRGHTNAVLTTQGVPDLHAEQQMIREVPRDGLVGRILAPDPCDPTSCASGAGLRPRYLPPVQELLRVHMACMAGRQTGDPLPGLGQPTAAVSALLVGQ